jgi:hypothetical protein
MSRRWNALSEAAQRPRTHQPAEKIRKKPSRELKEKSLAKGGERRACDHCDANRFSENDSPNVEVMKS